MNILFVKQKNAAGHEKVFRFNTERERFIIGTSRKADIRLPKDHCAHFEGCLELENGNWVYHSFTMSEKAPLIVSLKQGSVFRISEYEFSAKMIEQKSLFNESSTEGTLGEQIVMIFSRGQIFETHRIQPGQVLKRELAGEQLSIETRESREWVISTQGSFEIRQKTLIQSEKNFFLKSWKESLDMDRRSQGMAAGILATVLVGIMSLTFMPKSEMLMVDSGPPKSSAPMVLKMVPPSERQAQQPAGNKVAAAAKSTNRIADLSRAIANRAGNFMKKASRSPASIGPNGSINAPAMGVSRLDGPSTDWNAVAGDKVSGKIGGTLTGSGGNSRLAGTGVGQSGVNLLEQESEISGGLDREVIADFIRKNIGHILYCYERSLSANPNLFGKVSVRFVIGATGQVSTQKIGESTLKDGRVEGCILEKIALWKFPTPRGGVNVSVTYPFLFKTTN